jgi:two-component system, OmpR family, clock-associated histidine kinase SasA
MLFVTVLIISTLFQLLYVLPWLENREERNTQEEQSVITNNIARELDIRLEETRDLLINMAEWPEFKNMEIEAQQQLIDKLTGENLGTEILPQIFSLSVLNTDGIIVSFNIHSSIGIRSGYADIVSLVLQEEAYFPSPKIGPYNLFLAAHVLVPIRSDSGEAVGILFGHINLSNVTTSIQDYPVINSSQVSLLDREGTLIAQSGMNMFNLENGPLSLSYIDQPLAKNALKNNYAWGTSGSQEYVYNGTSYFGTYTTLRTNGWAVLVNTPMQTVLAKSNFLRNNLILINSLIFFLAIFVTYIFTHRITLHQKRIENELVKYKNHLEEMVSTRTRELTESNQKLENENKKKVEFTRIIVHELKSPLTSLQVANDLLIEEAKESPYRDIGSSISHSVSNLERTINELLDVARGEIGLLKLNYQKVNLEDFFNNLKNNYMAIAVNKGINLEFNIQPGIPEAALDKERISQIIYNLVDNAFKFTPKSKTVSFSARVDDGQLFVSVSDNGCGISKERQSLIFESNKISSSQNRSDIQRLSGLGIGLFLSKMLVELHKGRIWVESELGKGSNFIFSIPIQDTANM